MESEKTEKTSRATKRKQRDDGDNNNPQIERHRREKMTEYYTMLQSLVPDLFPKAPRTKIIEETINYINFLEHVITALNLKRRSTLVGPPLLLTQQNSSYTVEVSYSGKTVFFGISFISSRNIMVKILEVFEIYKADVLSASIVSEFGITRINVTSVVLDEECLERIKMDLLSI